MEEEMQAQTARMNELENRIQHQFDNDFNHFVLDQGAEVGSPRLRTVSQNSQLTLNNNEGEKQMEEKRNEAQPVQTPA